MKRQALLLIILSMIAALTGSYLTYTWYIQTVYPVQAESPSNSGTNAANNAAQVAYNDPMVGSDIVVRAVEKLSPSVVFITTKARIAGPQSNLPPGLPDDFDFFGPEGESRYRSGSGSGIIISEDGLILTNQHVVDNAENIKVKIDTSVNGNKGETKTYDARVIGEDRLTDVAILKIDATGLKAAELGDSDNLKVGEWVIALGNPLGYEHTVTVGVLSAKGRNLPIASDREYPNLLQTDAAINPGNSGGPLANIKGEVIGMNTVMSAQGQGIGFAIPINRIKTIKDQLISKGKVVRAFIGIQMMPMDSAKADYLKMPQSKGVLVYRVFQGTPAHLGGLNRGDVILEINGVKVNSPEELQKEIRNTEVGKEVVFKVWRNGMEGNVTVKVGEMPNPDSLKVRTR